MQKSRSGSGLGIAISHEKLENGKFVDEKFLTGKSDEKNEKLSSLIYGVFLLLIEVKNHLNMMNFQNF